MKPVQTTNHNFVYRRPQKGIGDLWVERRPAEHVVLSSWVPDAGEIKDLIAGAVIELGIYGMEPIPPVSIAIVPRTVVSENEPPKTTDAVKAQLGARGKGYSERGLPEACPVEGLHHHQVASGMSVQFQPGHLMGEIPEGYR
jgi:hypothetical protein